MTIVKIFHSVRDTPSLEREINTFLAEETKNEWPEHPPQVTFVNIGGEKDPILLVSITKEGTAE